MKLVLLLGCLAALVAAQPPVTGTATVTIDFQGFSPDVTVSVCSVSVLLARGPLACLFCTDSKSCA